MATTEPRTKKRKLLRRVKVIVGVGDAQKTYSIAKQILIKSSDFFKTACKDCWTRGRKKAIKLPEVEPSVFETYLQLLYTGEVVPNEDGPPPYEEDEAAESPLQASRFRFFAAVIELYILADMLLDSRSKNRIMDFLVESNGVVRRFPGKQVVELVYSKTVPSSALRRLVVDYSAYGCEAKVEHCKKILPEVPQQFAIDLSIAFMALAADSKEAVWPGYLPRSTYHEHDDANPKCE